MGRFWRADTGSCERNSRTIRLLSSHHSNDHSDNHNAPQNCKQRTAPDTDAGVNAPLDPGVLLSVSQSFDSQD